MSMLLAAQVWHINLDKTTAFVLMAMCDSANDDGTGCLASEEFLCWKTGVSRASLYRVIGRLTQMGVLMRITLADGRTETIIRLEKAPQKPEWSRPKRGRKFKSHHETQLSHHETHIPEGESHHETQLSHHETGLSQIETGRSNMTHPSDPSYVIHPTLARSAEKPADNGRADRAQQREVNREVEREAMKRDPLYGAFVRSLDFEPETRQMWDEWRIGINELNRLRATPQDVYRAVSAYYSRFPHATCSVRAIVKWWPALKEGKNHDIAKLEASQRASQVHEAETRQRADADREAARAELDKLYTELGITDPTRTPDAGDGR